MDHTMPTNKDEEHPHHDEDKRDLVTPVANLAMTPFSVIASTCLQVTLSSGSGSAEDKSYAFNLVSACIIATAGMLMAVFLVTTSSNNASKQRPPEGSWVAAKVKRFLLIDQPPIDEKERIRVARMMLRCLWFSLSYMTTGFLCKVLKIQLRVSDRVTSAIAIFVWIIFIWSSFGAPLPEFNSCLRMVGSVFTTAFPLILMAAYTALFLTVVS